MSEQSNKSIANSLETNERLLSYLPFLLQDLWALGSSIEEIIKLVGDLKLLSGQTKVLDLGCGKEAVSIQIARPDTDINQSPVLLLAGSQEQIKKYDELFCIYHVVAVEGQKPIQINPAPATVMNKENELILIGDFDAEDLFLRTFVKE